MTPPADPGRSRRAAGGGGGTATGTGHDRGGTGGAAAPVRVEPSPAQPSRAGSGWLLSRWDPASADGCPRCCRATLLLANQHQFFSGKLYVLLQ
ncbi:histone-lysine N-methyltransferase SETD1A-like [Corvus moneduloides]|uniref:histone-lysine N-methyltransferase SETD1A-like n=1 Tax=Corvus moneduloides TaxID=1196302 RepID=UPI0013639C2D|nr:histone-lysine N-methyltransferase SETD1A-like [Corvus moneduloides]